MKTKKKGLKKMKGGSSLLGTRLRTRNGLTMNDSRLGLRSKPLRLPEKSPVSIAQIPQREIITPTVQLYTKLKDLLDKMGADEKCKKAADTWGKNASTSGNFYARGSGGWGAAEGEAGGGFQHARWTLAA